MLPPEGVPDNVFTAPSQTVAVLVVLDAAPGSEFTVKLLSAVVASQSPLAATVYLILTVVFDVILAGVYVEPLIPPPPVTILAVPLPDIVFVLVSQIAAVLVLLVAAAGV